VLGAAWMTGALPALQERLPCAINDAQALRSLGIRVTVLTPGPEDLAAMGVNLMDPRRRTAVLETSLRTSVAALTGRGDGQPQVA
jgi:NTE family protein